MTRVPEVFFHCREIGLYDEYGWVHKHSDTIFGKKRVVVFALPGAFTPTCTSFQLPGYEDKYEEFKKAGIDEVYCLSVNDAFVMNAWFKSEGITNVKPLPDGSGEFTYAMGMSVNKANLGFGFRSWRYAMVVNDGEIEMMFEEPGKVGNCPEDPYGMSHPDTVLGWLHTGVK
jgi:peroxiredoxin